MVRDNRDSSWRIKMSPYYLLRRQVCYALNDEYFIYNNTASEQQYEVTVRTGFMREEAMSFSTATGLELSSTFEIRAGVQTGSDLFGFEATLETSLSFTASASLTLGYSTSTTLARQDETEVRRQVVCSRYTSLAVWNQTSEFILTRLNEEEVLKKWEVFEGGIFIDEYSLPQSDS